MKLMNLEVQDTSELQKERKQIAEELTKSGIMLEFMKKNQLPLSLIEKYPMKFLRLKKEIEKCHKCISLQSCKQDETGYYQSVQYEDDRLRFVYKPCLHQVNEIKRKQQENQENNHLRRYQINHLPKEAYHASFESIDVDKEDNIDYIKAVFTLRQWNPEDKCYYLYGAVGVGKTYLAACLANQFAKKGKSVAFIHMPTYLTDLKNAFSQSDEYDYYIHTARNVDFLVLDDIGAENISSWYRDEVLLGILNYRMNEKKSTCFTSNLTLDELQVKLYEKDGDTLAAERILERIRVLTKPLEIKGNNRRM